MSKVVKYEELQQNSTKDKLWVLISGKVYDVTKFIDEHPGGDEVILAEAARDATEAFEDVGHSDEARALLPGMLVGDFDEENDKVERRDPGRSVQAARVANAVQTGSNMMYFVPLSLLGAYFAWRYYSGSA
ncbi:cytochrome b5 [Moniliophthora roreri MCA 2997]|uniref:Cytochrome b5 n=1 Tax=Moniliophthora roreri (strain MCA 2997) TaxID=1381753 RepID=V2XRC8_MONRO|nr:cytochrome b5 [Moniliophthora roreri MCA 2997]